MMANKLGSLVFYLDISQASIQALSEEEIHMHLPQACVKLSGQIVKLLKCQYGLKQAGRGWYLLLMNWLVETMGIK